MADLYRYLITSVLVLGVLYGFYWLFLRQEPMFRFNRLYLLSSLLLAFILPLLLFLPDISWFSRKESAITLAVEMPTMFVNSKSAASGYNLQGIIIGVYVVGVSFFSLRLLLRMASLLKIKKEGVKEKGNDYNIVWSDKIIQPFSFLQTVYLSNQLKGTSCASEIFKHEYIHVKEKHSIDILFMQVLQILCWYNPFIFLLEKSMRALHEFEADYRVIHSGVEPEVYTRILFEQDSTALAVVLGNNFNYLLLKRRIIMMYKKTSRWARLKSIVVLPAAVIVLAGYILSCKPASQKLGDTNAANAAVSDTLSTPPVPPSPDTSLPKPPVPTSTTKSQNVIVAAHMPMFMGGEKARLHFLNDNIKYPPDAIKNKKQGTVYVQFVVKTDGSISDIKILRGIYESIDKEALRVVESMPKWQPGKDAKGNRVNVLYTMPIGFKLQTSNEQEDEEGTPKIAVESMPQFRGGEKARLKFLNDNIVYPAEAKQNKISGRVYVQFVVKTDGSVNEVKIIKGVDKSLDEEAVRVVKKMPTWQPGKDAKGNRVNVLYTMPIEFVL